MAEKKVKVSDEEMTEAKAAPVYDGDELVERFYMKDNHRYKDDIYVAVGLDNCYVPRGKTVKIKRKFADVIDRGMIQDSIADDYAQRFMAKD